MASRIFAPARIFARSFLFTNIAESLIVLLRMRKSNNKFHPLRVDTTWTLFLDRDGVINIHRPNDYVKSWVEFEFIPGALDALRILSKKFDRIVVVTNQKGVGRGLMTLTNLESIHARMLQEIRKHGGYIHAIYSATKLKEADTDRLLKPDIGMALLAKKDFPAIEFSKSIIVGDSISDLHFGKQAGMKTVFVGEQLLPPSEKQKLADYCYGSLAEFAISL